jgi:tetratricopeptide (TPR) repeat protein
MGRLGHDRIVRRLNQAEGYLLLDLPERALEILQARPDWATMQFEASFLTGEALRRLERYREALVPLERAARLRPGHVSVAIALGWCYKRTHRIAQAIDALERAARETPDEPLLHYNLACYWSLAGNPPRALDELATAVDLDPDLRGRIAAEPDFQNLRGHPDFERVAYGREPSA